MVDNQEQFREVTPSQDKARFYRPPHLPGVELASVVYRDRSFPVHTHSEYVVGTVLSGAEILTVGRRSHLITAGGVLRLHPDEAHSNHTVGAAALRYIVFYLPPDSIRAYLDAEKGETGLTFPTPALTNRKLCLTLINCFRTLRARGSLQLEQESAMVVLVNALAAHGEPRERPLDAVDPGIERARQWIDERFATGFGLAEVAAAAGMGVFRLAHLFKATFGLSPIAYRNQRRVVEARRLILQGLPISDAALQVGFADQSHLTRQFQRLVGTSPWRYLRE